MLEPQRFDSEIFTTGDGELTLEELADGLASAGITTSKKVSPLELIKIWHAPRFLVQFNAQRAVH